MRLKVFKIHYIGSNWFIKNDTDTIWGLYLTHKRQIDAFLMVLGRILRKRGAVQKAPAKQKNMNSQIYLYVHLYYVPENPFVYQIWQIMIGLEPAVEQWSSRSTTVIHFDAHLKHLRVFALETKLYWQQPPHPSCQWSFS